jgi:hypothetical protein
MDSKPLLLEALKLPETERAALARELLESLDSAVDPDVEAAWAADLRARVTISCAERQSLVRNVVLDVKTRPTLSLVEHR